MSISGYVIWWDSTANSSMANSDATPVIKTVEALIQAYAKGERNFSGISLGAVDLKGADLKGADLSYTDFAGADLNQAHLRGVDFSYAILRGANLSEADLRGVMLIGAELQEANLTAADLKDADYDPVETRFPLGFDPIKAGMKSDR